jgi:hypothetical protein
MPLAVVSVHSLVALNTAPLARAAQAYADLGLPVFPLVPRQKVPRVAHGFYRATTDLYQIRRWWSAWPDANIGIPTGTPSGLWVLDVDPRHGGLQALDLLERHASDWGITNSLRATLRQHTGGRGLHLCYQMPASPGGAPPNGACAGYPGIDFKQTGGYIVVSPSIHPSGWAYRWDGEYVLAPFPPALLDLWIEARQRALARSCSLTQPGDRRPTGHPSPLDGERDPTYWLHVAVRKARPGCRHRYACFLAIQLVKIVGCSFEEAAGWMREYVARVPQPSADPYGLKDALDCLRYAWRKYAS